MFDEYIEFETKLKYCKNVILFRLPLVVIRDVSSMKFEIRLSLAMYYCPILSV